MYQLRVLTLLAFTYIILALPGPIPQGAQSAACIQAEQNEENVVNALNVLQEVRTFVFRGFYLIINVFGGILYFISKMLNRK